METSAAIDREAAYLRIILGSEVDHRRSHSRLRYRCTWLIVGEGRIGSVAVSVAGISLSTSQVSHIAAISVFEWLYYCDKGP